MSQTRVRTPVRRDRAETYVLTFLVAFAVTVIATRVYLEAADYPQLGNSVLHVAHALWGGLLLFVAVLLPLGLANRWAIQASALFGGMGTGLFIDEVGKFITQANDYFFPPSLSIIYGFVLLTVFIYLYFRRPRQPGSRQAMYHAWEGLQDALDGDLDVAEAAWIEVQLTIAKTSNRDEIVSLAEAMSQFLQGQRHRLPVAAPNYWKRVAIWAATLGQRLGRRTHRILIFGLLMLWAALAIVYIVVLARAGINLDSQVVQWRDPLMAIQGVVGTLMIVALGAWLAGKEELGLKFGVGGFLLSLIGLQTLYFYLSQFSALTTTLLQLALLQILLAYRRWYLPRA